MKPNDFRAIIVLLIALSLAATPPAGAQAVGYPDIGDYRPVNNEIYRVVDAEGVWLTTPLGLHCAIDDSGSFGCSGALPGVPAGDNEIAWFVGDPYPRLYATDQPRFDSGAQQSILVGKTVIDYHGARCAVTSESAIYCIHGDNPNSQLMVTSARVFRGADASPSS
ncbi:hypothetical protein ORI20_10365 [Mycobacterium sp. CVI_P3]|uniref:Uncharacterized protein n=1 Tax=Mycobacterium pinniadriaticum TaxID=2994102 RepID=A0ABT3SC69_9MYCO|nr:hypothetical protein [Mycobacterium pinniadriaticum]MCX2930682.1 hypothetical protein [Mycobacterium pinniadriaticum]MCX2937106.1 hypothetical protein [Mycobacterium pinniadriaticum]